MPKRIAVNNQFIDLSWSLYYDTVFNKAYNEDDFLKGNYLIYLSCSGEFSLVYPISRDLKINSTYGTKERYYIKNLLKAARIFNDKILVEESYKSLRNTDFSKVLNIYEVFSGYMMMNRDTSNEDLIKLLKTNYNFFENRTEDLLDDVIRYGISKGFIVDPADLGNIKWTPQLLMHTWDRLSVYLYGWRILDRFGNNCLILGNPLNGSLEYCVAPKKDYNLGFNRTKNISRNTVGINDLEKQLNVLEVAKLKSSYMLTLNNTLKDPSEQVDALSLFQYLGTSGTSVFRPPLEGYGPNQADNYRQNIYHFVIKYREPQITTTDNKKSKYAKSAVLNKWLDTDRGKKIFKRFIDQKNEIYKLSSYVTPSKMTNIFQKLKEEEESKA